jgi:hypothetical protein
VCATALPVFIEDTGDDASRCGVLTHPAITSIAAIFISTEIRVAKASSVTRKIIKFLCGNVAGTKNRETTPGGDPLYSLKVTF